MGLAEMAMGKKVQPAQQPQQQQNSLMQAASQPSMPQLQGMPAPQGKPPIHPALAGLPHPTAPQPQPENEGAEAAPDSETGEQSHAPYNGEISFQGHTILVKDGVIQRKLGGVLYVTPNGEAVVNEKRQIIGYIADGEFKPMDDQQRAKLQKAGVLQ